MRKLRSIDQTKSLIEYLEKNLKKGYKLEDLKWSLIAQGHSRVSVDKAVKFVSELEKAKHPQKIKEIQEFPIQDIKIQEKKSFFGRLKDFFR